MVTKQSRGEGTDCEGTRTPEIHVHVHVCKQSLGHKRDIYFQVSFIMSGLMYTKFNDNFLKTEMDK